jgi:tetratricopeptide (TPR) repeat protein
MLAWNDIPQERFEEARSVGRRAQELDPLYPESAVVVGLADYFSHRYDAALDQFRKAVDVDRNYFWADVWVGNALIQLGRVTEALAAYEKAHQLDDNGESAAVLGYGYAAASDRNKAGQVIDDLIRQSKERYIQMYYPSAVCARLGDKDRAFQLLEKALEQHTYMAGFLKVDPMMDPLRSDPRFSRLVRRLGLGN